MIIIGGDGTLDSARVIDEAGMPTIGIPKRLTMIWLLVIQL